FAWRTHSPLARAKTTPLATAGAAGVMRFREIHALVRTGLPPFSSTLNAAMLPTLASPLFIANVALGCFGPQTGASTQRAPCASSHDDRLPHVPAPAKSISSFEIRSDRKSGVRWSVPPSDCESSRKKRPSLPDPTSSSRPFYGNTTGVTFMSRSRLYNHSALVGTYQSFSFSSFGVN